MRRTKREQLEQELRELCQQNNVDAAVVLALKEFGPELIGLMTSLLPDYDRRQDAYSLFSVNLLRGLRSFRWESSFRTWAYQLARNACYQVMRREAARPEKPMSLSVLSDVAMSPRSMTAPWQRTSMKNRLHALYESLDPQQRTLLFLRLEQRLSWTDVARVMGEEGAGLTDAELKRKAAALRQQFKHLKDHLRSLFQKEGLLGTEDAASPM